ncbi:MAG: GYD domain-containing protein [Actinobacteria bacterium]|nr:GYD domain-containing protein [Actinomycetota bacterium]
MPTFIMLSTLGPDGAARVVDQPERIREVKQEVEAMGVKVISQYATLGQYDFINIIEAPDEKAMARVAMKLASRGTLKTLTLTAIPVEDFITALKDQ